MTEDKKMQAALEYVAYLFRKFRAFDAPDFIMTDEETARRKYAEIGVNWDDIKTEAPKEDKE